MYIERFRFVILRPPPPPPLLPSASFEFFTFLFHPPHSTTESFRYLRPTLSPRCRSYVLQSRNDSSSPYSFSSSTKIVAIVRTFMEKSNRMANSLSRSRMMVAENPLETSMHITRAHLKRVSEHCGSFPFVEKGDSIFHVSDTRPVQS